ncbi:MAG: alpha/beta hydrolase [Acidimicrobiia bacterium]
MSGLQEPPTRDQPSRVVVRILMLVVLVLAAGLTVWTSVTNQRIDLIEDVPAREIELIDFTMVGNLRINVVTEPGGVVPVILLHDRDVAGGVTLDDVAGGLEGRFQAVRLDLPGYGLSDRLPSEGLGHTVASMAQVVSAVIEERFAIPVVIAGVGFGGRVAAEVAVSSPDLVRGVVLIDVDFWEEDGWIERIERLPWVGRAVTFSFETGGRFAMDMWAPNCAEGGWCPRQNQIAARGITTTIRGSTDSIRSSLRTQPSSLVPSDLAKIVAPVAYVWSRDGDVPFDSVERVKKELPNMTVTEVDAWQAHLESPGAVIDAIDMVGR